MRHKPCYLAQAAGRLALRASRSRNATHAGLPITPVASGERCTRARVEGERCTRARALEGGGVPSNESLYGCFGWSRLAPRIPRLRFIRIVNPCDDAGQVFLGNSV